jgi:hypothetical protein
VVLIDAKRPSDWKEATNPADCAEWLGLRPLHGFLDWDLFDAVLMPGHIILMATFKDGRQPPLSLIPDLFQTMRSWFCANHPRVQHV